MTLDETLDEAEKQAAACICANGFGMSLSCQVHGVVRESYEIFKREMAPVEASAGVPVQAGTVADVTELRRLLTLELQRNEQMEATIAALEPNARRYQFLTNLPKAQAQAFFWNWDSRKDRAKAIDAAIAAATDEVKL